MKASKATRETIMERIEDMTTRSAWSKAVAVYASEILDSIPDGEIINRETALNGARDWSQYSYGGCSLVYICEIAERVCTPSMLKRKRGGDLDPSNRETWLDVQAKALSQAWWKIYLATR